MGGGLLVSSKFWAAMKAPKAVAVLAQEATSTSASGATAPDHSASNAASPSAPFLPGSVQPVPGWICLKVPEYEERPNAERKVATSAAFISVTSRTATVCPLPRSEERR